MFLRTPSRILTWRMERFCLFVCLIVLWGWGCIVWFCWGDGGISDSFYLAVQDLSVVDWLDLGGGGEIVFCFVLLG